MAARPGRWLYFVTLTAPGDGGHCLPDGSVCRCTPAAGVDLARWNAGHSACWNRWRTWLRSVVPGVEFIRGIEVQKRGALHDHAIIDSPIPLPLARWKAEMRSRAIDAGYGHSFDVTEIAAGSRKAAFYISKYITKACDQRDSVPWAVDVIDLETGELIRGSGAATYRTWSSSRGWGMTMADARSACRDFVLRRRDVQHDELVARVAASLGATVLQSAPAAMALDPP